jgi:WhiB family redox-sensing transcriptional regulator
VNPNVAACGTESGYGRHRRLGEAACAECLNANRLGRQRRATTVAEPKRMRPPTVGERDSFPVLPRADWMEDAACRAVDPEWFFSDDPADQSRALLACELCQVRDRCLGYALQAGTYGIWAGFLPHELDQLRRRRSA